LQFDDFGGVLNDLGDVRSVACTNFTQDTFEDPNDTADKPETPKDTNRIEGTVRGSVRLYHAEHAVQLPVDKEWNKQVMRIPESLKVFAPFTLPGCPGHNTETDPHNPACYSRACFDAKKEEYLDTFTRAVARLDSEVDDIDDVGESVHQTPDYKGPRSGLVEGNIFIERNEIVERRPSQEGNKVSANWKQNVYNVDMAEQSASSSNRETKSKNLSSIVQVILGLVVEETKDPNKQMEEDEDSKEELSSTFIDHPDPEFLAECFWLGYMLDNATRASLQAL